jgi:hypothetical protein
MRLIGRDFEPTACRLALIGGQAPVITIGRDEGEKPVALPAKAYA